MPINPINSLNDSIGDIRGGEIPLGALNDNVSGVSEAASPKINPVIPTSKVTTVDPFAIKAPGQDRSKFLKMTTNFRTLKYSSDQPHDGTSYQPYITADLARGFQDPMPQSYSDNKGLRGIELVAAIDKDRIQKFLSSNAKGKLFKDKQKQLNFFNPKMEVGLNYAYINTTAPGVLEKLIPGSGRAGGLEFTRIYNDNLNLLQQVGVQGTGIHFDAPGAQPVIPFQSKYEYVVSNKPADTNRLVLLFNNKIVDNSFKNLITTPNLSDVNKTGIARGQNKIFEYLGGPGASDENSMTVIGRYSYTTDWKAFSKYTDKIAYAPTSSAFLRFLPKPTAAVGIANTAASGSLLPNINVPSGKILVLPGDVVRDLSNSNLPFDPSNNKTSLSHKAYATASFNEEDSTYSAINRASTMTYRQLVNAGGNSLNISAEQKADFRINNSNYDQYGYAQGYRADVLGMGSPGSARLVQERKKVTYNKIGYGDLNDGVDEINAAELNVNSNPDMVKFSITAVETQQNGSSIDVAVAFRSFVTNFSDNINANYDTHQYIGRGENFYTYKNSERKISFQLAIAAQSRAEMKPLYRKINYLISQLYPGYSGVVNKGGNGFMRAPLVKMTVGDYISDQPGFLNSIQLSVPNESPWEIVDDPGNKDADMYQLPHYLLLNINFTPIHNFIARRSHKSGQPGVDYSITPFITPNTSNNKFEIAK